MGGNMIGKSVLSLQTGQPLARIDAPIINPNNLKIVAFYVSGPMVDFAPAILFTEDIREYSELGMIVDSSDNIMSPEGMVRLNQVVQMNFTLDGINVVDENKRKLGKVENYTIDSDNFQVQQLHIRPTLIKSLSVANLVVARGQIIEINNEKITVAAPTVRDGVASKMNELTENSIPFENPFRKPTPVNDNIEKD